jgi:hypothetical protein
VKKQSIGILVLVALLLSVMAGAGPTLAQPDPMINEFVFNHTGADTHEYVEIYGAPSTDYSAYTIVEIEGDGTGAGLIDDGTTAVGTTDANGFWCNAYQSDLYENGTVTLLLVMGYSGSVGNDIDTDDDGVIDTTYWTSIVDGVGVHDGGASDHTYAGVELGDNYDGLSAYHPGGASRIPNGYDSDSIWDWRRNDFDGDGLPDPPFSSPTPTDGEATNTPCATNGTATAVTLAALGASSGGLSAVLLGLGLVAMLTGGGYLALRRRRK